MSHRHLVAYPSEQAAIDAALDLSCDPKALLRIWPCGTCPAGTRHIDLWRLG